MLWKLPTTLPTTPKMCHYFHIQIPSLRLVLLTFSELSSIIVITIQGYQGRYRNCSEKPNNIIV